MWYSEKENSDMQSKVATVGGRGRGWEFLFNVCRVFMERAVGVWMTSYLNIQLYSYKSVKMKK